MGIRCQATERLCELNFDPVPEVRAAMLHAVTTFIGIPDLTDQVAQREEALALAVLPMAADGSVIVRKELLVFFSTFAKRHQNKFLVAAYEELKHEKQSLQRRLRNTSPMTQPELQNGFVDSDDRIPSLSHNTTIGTVWKQILILSVDPHPDIAQGAGVIVDYIHLTLLDSPMASVADKMKVEILDLTYRLSQKLQITERPQAKKTATLSNPPSSAASNPKQEGYIAQGLRRTASYAASLFGTTGSGDASSESSQPPSPKNRVPMTPRGRAPPEWTRPPEGNDYIAPPPYRLSPSSNPYLAWFPRKRYRRDSHNPAEKQIPGLVN